MVRTTSFTELTNITIKQTKLHHSFISKLIMIGFTEINMTYGTDVIKDYQLENNTIRIYFISNTYSHYNINKHPIRTNTKISKHSFKHIVKSLE